MTPLKYLISTGVATTAEIISFKKNDVTGRDYESLINMTKEQMKNQGVEITEQ